MAERKSISKKTRFEVFKRDSFTCQYCGRSAPEIVLHLDHIHPVSKDGDESVFNYITSCEDCNQGKSDRLLSDNSTLTKQKAQLDELQERREQIEMMLEWRQGLKNITESEIDIAIEARNATTPGWSVNENGRKTIGKLIRTFGLQTVLDSIDTAAEQYLKFDNKGVLIEDTVHISFDKLGGICRMSTQPDWKRELYYLRGILRNRLSYFNNWQGFQILEDAFFEGVELSELRWIATHVSSWTKFKNEVDESIRRVRKERRETEKDGDIEIEDNG